MKQILTKTFSHQVGALINKLASCETANDMLLVDEAFHTQEKLQG